MKPIVFSCRRDQLRRSSQQSIRHCLYRSQRSNDGQSKSSVEPDFVAQSRFRTPRLFLRQYLRPGFEVISGTLENSHLLNVKHFTSHSSAFISSRTDFCTPVTGRLSIIRFENFVSDSLKRSRLKQHGLFALPEFL